MLNFYQWLVSKLIFSKFYRKCWFLLFFSKITVFHWNSWIWLNVLKNTVRGMRAMRFVDSDQNVQQWPWQIMMPQNWGLHILSWWHFLPVNHQRPHKKPLYTKGWPPLISIMHRHHSTLMILLLLRHDLFRNRSFCHNSFCLVIHWLVTRSWLRDSKTFQ